MHNKTIIQKYIKHDSINDFSGCVNLINKIADINNQRFDLLKEKIIEGDIKEAKKILEEINNIQDFLSKRKTKDV